MLPSLRDDTTPLSNKETDKETAKSIQQPTISHSSILGWISQSANPRGKNTKGTSGTTSAQPETT